MPCQAEGNLNNPYSKMPSVLWWCFCLFQYFAESHAVIYIVDSSDTERIDESKDAFGRCVYVVCQSCNCVFILSQTRNTVSFPLQKRWSPMPSYKESLCWFWPINRTYRLDDCDLLEFIQNNSGSTITSERNLKKNLLLSSSVVNLISWTLIKRKCFGEDKWIRDCRLMVLVRELS